MKVKPLFQYDETISPEDLIQFLDLPASDPKKRAFLEACNQHPKLARAWAHSKRLTNAGKSLPQFDPPKDIRNQILLQAQAHAQSEEFKQAAKARIEANASQAAQPTINTHETQTTVTQLVGGLLATGWRQAGKYTWQFGAAATFMLLSLTVYMQNQPVITSDHLTFTLVAQVERLDDELHQLEEDMALLGMSMGLIPVPPAPDNQESHRAG